MNVRKALWIAGLGSMFALPVAAMAQTVTEAPLVTVAPSETVASEGTEVAPSRIRRFLTRADPVGPSRFWFNSEALLMWTKSMNVPPLVTTGPIDILNAGGVPGTLGVVGTTTLVEKRIGFGPELGGRFTLGGWVLPEVPMGVEVSYFFIGQGTAGRQLSETGLPGSQALSLPFFNAATNAESAVPIALPTTPGFGGTVNIRTTTRLQGWEVTGGTDFGNFGCVHVIGLGGYRYLGIRESLRITTSRTNTDAAVGEVFQTTDNFNTTNAFNGGQVGLKAEIAVGQLSVEATGKVALGHIRQEMKTDGSVVTNGYNGFGVPQTFNSGFLATGTNSGSFGRDRLAVIPDVQLTANWQPCDWLRLSVGYQTLYFGNVARPNDQIDRAINPSQSAAYLVDQTQTLVGPARPILPPVAHSDFWVQGVTAGLELKF